MNVNELNCRANQKVIESLDQRVAVLEEGGGGGTEYTAGDGIKIEDDVISLDNGWEEVEASELYSDKFDFDKYEYKIEGVINNVQSTKGILFIVGKSNTAGKYYGFVVEDDTNVYYHNFVITPTATGISQSVSQFYVVGSDHAHFNSYLKLKDFDGTVIDASNFATYFDTTEMKCIKSCVATFQIAASWFQANTIVMPGDTVLTIFGMYNYPVAIYGLRQTVSNLKHVIVDGSTSNSYRPDSLELRIKNNQTMTFQKYYRRLKI